MAQVGRLGDCNEGNGRAQFSFGCLMEEGFTSKLVQFLVDFSVLSYETWGFCFLMALAKGSPQLLEPVCSPSTHGMP